MVLFALGLLIGFLLFPVLLVFAGIGEARLRQREHADQTALHALRKRLWAASRTHA